MSKRFFTGIIQKSFSYIFLLFIAGMLIIGAFSCRNVVETTFDRTETMALAKIKLADKKLNELVQEIEDMTERLDGYKEYFLSTNSETISKANAYLARTMSSDLIGACVLQTSDGRVYTYNPDGIFMDILQLRLFCGTNSYGVSGLKWFNDDDPDRISPYKGYCIACTDISEDDMSYTRVYYFVKKSVLNNILDEIYDKNNIAMIMDNGKPLLVSDRDRLEKITKSKTDILFRFSDFDTSNYNFEKYDEHYVIACYKTPDSNFMLLALYESSGLYREMYQIALVMCILILLFLLIAVIIYRHLHRQYIMPLNVLSENIGKGKTNFGSINGSEEIKCLAQGCNDMQRQINKLINDAKLQEKKVQRIEMTAMHRQLTPHFFYNTLSNIRLMAVSRGQEELGTIISRFAEMNKYLFSNDSDFVTLKQELEFIKNYVSLMNIRYFNRINTFYLADEELYNSKIPVFMLQPIVENAIVHGLTKRLNEKEAAFLRITAKAEEEQLVISICDNGCGIPKEKIDRIMSMLETGRNDFGIGLYNTLSRLEYYYKNRYSFNVDSQEEEFTDITVKIPLEFDDNFNI